MRRHNHLRDKQDNAQRSMSKNNNNKNGLHEILGEVSDSEFDSPSTDDNATDYNISNLNRTNFSQSKTRTPLKQQERFTNLSSSRASAPVTANLNRGTRRKQSKPKKSKIDKEILKCRKATDPLIPKLPFSRLIREILLSLDTAHAKRITYNALQALQEISEIYIVALFQDSYLCTLHRNRVTLSVKDIELVRYFRGANDPVNRQD